MGSKPLADCQLFQPVEFFERRSIRRVCVAVGRRAAHASKWEFEDHAGNIGGEREGFASEGFVEFVGWRW